MNSPEEIQKVIDCNEVEVKRLEGEILSIVAQLEEAKVVARQTGDYESNLDWRKSAKYALHSKKLQRRNLNKDTSVLKQELSKATKKKVVAERNANVERNFVSAAKEVLSDTVFRALLEEAYRRSDKEEPTC